MEKQLWLWNWIGGGYNSCRAATRQEALAIGNAMSASTTLKIDETTLRVGSQKELSTIDQRYAGMFN